MNLNWKNIVAALVLLIFIYVLSASLNAYALEIDDFKLSNFSKDKTEVFFKFCSFAVLGFMIDFKKK